MLRAKIPEWRQQASKNIDSSSIELKTILLEFMLTNCTRFKIQTRRWSVAPAGRREYVPANISLAVIHINKRQFLPAVVPCMGISEMYRIERFAFKDVRNVIGIPV